MAGTIRNAVILGIVGAVFVVWLAGCGPTTETSPPGRFYVVTLDKLSGGDTAIVIKDTWSSKCYLYVDGFYSGAGLGEVTCGDTK